jgi:hypothetical protein
MNSWSECRGQLLVPTPRATPQQPQPPAPVLAPEVHLLPTITLSAENE